MEGPVAVRNKQCKNMHVKERKQLNLTKKPPKKLLFQSLCSGSCLSYIAQDFKFATPLYIPDPWKEKKTCVNPDSFSWACSESLSSDSWKKATWIISYILWYNAPVYGSSTPWILNEAILKYLFCIHVSAPPLTSTQKSGAPLPLQKYSQGIYNWHINKHQIHKFFCVTPSLWVC